MVIWDAWLCEGSKVIFRYGLALLKMYKKRLKALSESLHVLCHGTRQMDEGNGNGGSEDGEISRRLGGKIPSGFYFFSST